MRRFEVILVDLFLGIGQDVVARLRGEVPELKRIIVPFTSITLQKCRGVVVRTHVLCKLQESTLISVVLWLDFEAKVTGQLFVMFKKTTYIIEVLVKLHHPL
jgi:hypothetical protein